MRIRVDTVALDGAPRENGDLKVQRRERGQPPAAEAHPRSEPCGRRWLTGEAIRRDASPWPP